MLDAPMLLWSRKFWTLVLKVVGIEHPSAVRDGDAELMFFIALAGERGVSKALAAR